MKRVSNREAQPLIAARKEFTNATKRANGRPGSFRGVTAFEGRGHLPEMFVIPSLLAAGYVVYSYNTPLAWFHDDTWHYASIAYSPTTSEHQHIVRMAINSTDRPCVYHGGDWREVPGAGRFWDGKPKINASTGTPAGYYGINDGPDGAA